MEKTLKRLLKILKLNESTVSMFLGLAVVLVIGGMIVNYLRNKPAEVPTFDDQQLKLVDEAQRDEFAEIPADKLPPFKGELPVTYEVRAGDNLWKIAERYYQTGYAWTEIANANNLKDAGNIEKGQSLVIPQLSKAYPLTVEESELATGGVASASDEDLSADELSKKADLQVNEEQMNTESNDQQLAMSDEANSESDSAKQVSRFGDDISGDSYTVVKGDHLWGIADRAYHDPYKWVEIARLNELPNPGLIIPGEVLKLPR